jgi:hypothetical protein
MNPIFETVKQLSVTEQIDLLHYLTKQVNKQTKLVHVAFLPIEETQPAETNDPILTNDEFEILLEWLTHLRQQQKTRLGLSNQKRLKLIELVTDSFMQDIPQWGAGAEFWPEDDIEIFDQFLQEARAH